MKEFITADNIHSSDVTAIFTTRNSGDNGIVASSQGFRAEDIIGLRQMHTDKIITVDKTLASDRPINFPDEEGDALVTDIKGILISVRTADCVPILLYDRTNGAVGAVHAGWRGTFAQIGTKTVSRMAELYGTVPVDVKAAIGPAIGICCYEVDFDFYEKFRKEYGVSMEKFFTLSPENKPRCDLKAINAAFLIEAGIPANNIVVSEFCTMCNPELFHSYRRSGDNSGRMTAFIGMKPTS